jgi:cell division protein FtsB
MPPAPLETEPATSLRRKARAAASAPAPPAGRRKTVQVLLVFVTLVLVINALVGERGLMETLRARRTYQELVSSIDRLRSENTRLREQVRRLRTDPKTIEALARQELGLMKPGEVLFIIRDARPASRTANP